MGELLNVVGLGTGIVLYAMLLFMVLRVRHAPGVHGRFDPLLLLTAVLGLVWNLCALQAYELPKIGSIGPSPSLTALGLAALGFLPAVVVHSVLRGERDDLRSAAKRALATLAYGLATCAGAVQLAMALRGRPVPSPFGTQLLTYSFVALIVPLAFITRGQPRSRRTLWMAALAIFAVSALHLSQLHRGDSSWLVELLGHHASLPLALAILYQDYPFALADLFLKRTLALLAIIGVAAGAVALMVMQSLAVASVLLLDQRQAGVVVTLCVATALVYPSVRRITAWFVDRVVLARPDYRTLRAELVRRIHTQQDTTALLDEVCATLAPALNAVDVTWREWHAPLSEADTAALTVSGNRAMVVVQTAETPRFAFHVGALRGGRRLLSDDLATFEFIANAVARRVDGIRMTKERYEREIREQEMAKLASEAELRALRAQINPHFLFNALTTIGYLIQTAPPRALQTLMRLTSLLRAVLRSEGEFTTLGREVDLVEAYLDTERERFEQRLRVTIDVPAHLRSIRVPPLVIQPLVENAVKHGISQKQLGGEVTIRASLDESAGTPCLRVLVDDTGGGASGATLTRGRETGVGLRNVERRLACQYGASASLSIVSTPGEGTTVKLCLPAQIALADTPTGVAV